MLYDREPSGIDPFDFYLAEKLCKSLKEVHELSSEEIEAWKDYYHYKQEMESIWQR